MKRDDHSFLYKQKFNKKLKKFIYNEESNYKISAKKINNFNKNASRMLTKLDTDQNKGKQNTVIPKYNMEKSFIYIKNSFKTSKNSFNNNYSEEYSTLTNQFREIKENIPFNGFYRGLLSTKSKSKKLDKSFNNYIQKKGSKF